MGEGNAIPRLFVVDDEPDLVDLYAATLGNDFEVKTAYGGPEAIDIIEQDARFDVALIDRRMPDVSGDEVLERLHDAAPDCRVAMITAVEPDFDVVDMPFDEYLVKPVSRAGVRETVERLLRMQSYREQRREDYALASKLAALQAHKEPEDLEGNDEYEELLERMASVRAELDATAEGFEPGDFVVAFADITQDVQATQLD